MDYEKILLDIHDGIATVTLNRPEAYNALDRQLATEFHDAIVTCSEDEAVRAVRLFNEKVAADSRLTATAIQTVGVKGYDGFVLARVGS